MGEGDLVIIISQSGETADSKAAMALAKEYGAKTLAIVNAKGSSIAREADMVVYTHAGPEISVASTKAYMVQISVMYLIAFGYVNVLKTAADASWLREEVLTNNIANVDTPNYKRQDVEFSSYLANALQRSGKNSSSLTQRVNNVDYKDISIRTYTDNSTLSYRTDGNNVDLSTENVELASEQINYNALIDSMNNEFSRFKSVLK